MGAHELPRLLATNTACAWARCGVRGLPLQIRYPSGGIGQDALAARHAAGQHPLPSHPSVAILLCLRVLRFPGDSPAHSGHLLLLHPHSSQSLALQPLPPPPVLYRLVRHHDSGLYDQGRPPILLSYAPIPRRLLGSSWQGLCGHHPRPSSRASPSTSNCSGSTSTFTCL